MSYTAKIELAAAAMWIVTVALWALANLPV
jgi:hypothetical protein